MNDIPELERVVFFERELLTADDLTTLDSNNRELRWLHNRSLHNWGIGYGLDVAGANGDTFVTVNPGYAIDKLGREIILSHPVQQPIPAVPGPATYFLVANYVPDAQQTTSQERDTEGCDCSSACACSASGAIRLTNDPAILWKTIAQLAIGIDVILAEVLIQNCALSGTPSAAPRRYATCGAPYTLKAGLLQPKDIRWQPLQPSGTNTGFTTAVDTSAAKFQTTPQYFVNVVGDRVLSGADFVVIDFITITGVTRSGFTLHVALPAIATNINPGSVTHPVNGPAMLQKLQWSISWAGVEA